MIQQTEPLAIWHFRAENAEYIVAARGSSDASEAFGRSSECRGQTPQPYPAQRGRAGQRLATEHPGVVYRRNLASAK